MAQNQLIFPVFWHGARSDDLYRSVSLAQDQMIDPIGLYSSRKISWSAPVCFLSAKSANFSLTWCCLNISWSSCWTADKFIRGIATDLFSDWTDDGSLLFTEQSEEVHIWKKPSFLKVLLLEIVDVATVSNREQCFWLAYVWKREHFTNATLYGTFGTFVPRYGMTRCFWINYEKVVVARWGLVRTRGVIRMGL